MPDSNGSLLSPLGYLLGFEGMPLVFPLWYIKDLLVICAFSPLIYLLLKTKQGRCISILLVGMGLLFSLLPCTMGVSPDSFFWFMCGAAVALSRYEWSDAIYQWHRFNLVISGSLFFVFILIFVLSVYHIPTYLANPYVVNAIQFFFIATGIPSILYCSQSYTNKHPQLSGIIRWLSASSFFVYAFHTPIPYAVIEKVLFLLLPMRNVYVDTLRLLLFPILIMCISLAAYRLVTRLPKGFSRLFTGGR